MRLWKQFALALAVVVVAAGAAIAQENNAPGGRGRFPGGLGGLFGGQGAFGGQDQGLAMLRMEDVQKELELVDDQKAQLRKIGEEMMAQMRDSFAGLRDLSREERAAKVTEMRGKLEESLAGVRKQIDAVLLPNQRDRLKQLTLQAQMRRGGVTAALSEGETGKALGLSDEQKKQLREREDAMMKELEAKTAQLRREYQEKVVDVLSSDQRAKLKSLTGEPFNVQLPGPQQFRQLLQQRSGGNRPAQE